MKWISKINQVPQVALMSTNLADILRFCISPEEFVPLRREVQILERYIEIQKIRLSGAFAFEADVPPGVGGQHGAQNDPAAHRGKCDPPRAGGSGERHRPGECPTHREGVPSDHCVGQRQRAAAGYGGRLQSPRTGAVSWASGPFTTWIPFSGNTMGRTLGCICPPDPGGVERKFQPRCPCSKEESEC